MPVTEQDARALTYLVKRLREETHGANHWDEAGIFAVIAKLAGRNLAITIEQVTRHAADPEAKTPGAINRPFLPEAPKGERLHPPKRGEDCPRHPGQWAENCGGCAADAIGVGYEDEAPPPKPPKRWDAATEETKAEALKVMRRDIGRAKGWAGEAASVAEPGQGQPNGSQAGSYATVVPESRNGTIQEGEA